jgi:acyl carrier protein
MQDRIKAVMAQIFNVDIGAINAESSPENVERWDSLRHMQLIMAIEDEFGVTFSDDEIPDLLSLSLIENSVGKLVR